MSESNIIRYKSFEKETDFIKWQKETPRSISSITPMVKDLQGSQCNNNLSVDASYTVFVIYIERNNG